MTIPIYPTFRGRGKPGPSELGVNEPETLPSWVREVEREALRSRTVTILRRMVEREERERLAALSWPRRCVERWRLRLRSAGRNG